MPLIHLVDGLDLKMSEGFNLQGKVLQPCFVNDEAEADPIPAYLSQGSLDGACGVYALLIALTVAGAFDDDAAQESALGRGFEGLQAKYKLGPLITEGLNVTQLRTFLSALDDGAGGWRLHKVAGEAGTASQFRQIVNTLQASPVILGVEEHWTVAIGWELSESVGGGAKGGVPTADSHPNVGRLLLLDPAPPLPVAAYWNAVLTRLNWSGPPRFQYSASRRSDRTPIEVAYQLKRIQRSSPTSA
jgi:hypothetical protein